MIDRIREWDLLTTLRWYYRLWRMRRNTADIKRKVCELTGLTDHEVFVQVDKNGAVNINLYPDAPAHEIYQQIEYDEQELKRWIEETYDLT